MKKIIALGMLVVIIVEVIILILQKKENELPIIAFSNEEVVYQEGDERTVLLKGVSASDKEDGEISDSLIIESITFTQDNSKVRVIYATKDSKNQVVKKERILSYETIEQAEAKTLASTGIPVIKLKVYEVSLAVGSSFNPLDYVEKAIDDKDNAWRKIHVDGEYDIQTPGRYSLAFSITDSEGKKSNVEEFVLVVE